MRMWELILKIFRNIGYFLSGLSLKLQVGSIGAGSKVLPGVLVSGGKNESCQRKYEQPINKVNYQVRDTERARIGRPGLAVESETGKAQRAT